jgi:hypothetical protein
MHWKIGLSWTNGNVRRAMRAFLVFYPLARTARPT